MVNQEKYTYRVSWSEDDQEHVGLCAEFPSLSWLEKDQGAALNGIVRLVGEIIEDMAENGEDVPEPLSLRTYKGNIALRVTPHRHRQLALEAAEQGVSVNRLINNKLG